MRFATIVFPPALALAFAACSDVQPPVAPSSRLSDLATMSSTRGEASTKTDICHRAGGSYILISVAAPALDAHFAHGDGRIGDLVPGQPGMRFASDCSLEPIHIILIPAVDGSVRDGMVIGPPKDGTPEVVFNFLGIINSPSVDLRAIMEFDISTILQPVGHAELRLAVQSWSASLAGSSINAYVYAGDGAVTLSDFAAGAFATTFSFAGQTEVTFDVTSAVNSLIASKAGYAGFKLRLFPQSTQEYPQPPGIFFYSLQSPPAPTLDLRTP